MAAVLAAVWLIKRDFAGPGRPTSTDRTIYNRPVESYLLISRSQKFNVTENLGRRKSEQDSLTLQSDSNTRHIIFEDSPLRSTWSNELQAIMNRIDSCLASTEMLTYFREKGYYEKAQENARLVLATFRNIFPKLSTPYRLPCWNTTFQAKKGHQPNVFKYMYMYIEGSIGNYQFSYQATIPAHNQILNFAVSRTNAHSFVCLPKIFLLGYPKCGSTYFYCFLHKILKLTNHSSCSSSCEVTKEPHWWVITGPRSLHTQPLSTDYSVLYLLNFVKGAEFAEKGLPALTIDASPNLMFQFPRYTEEETMENYCLIPALIPSILPDSKYFVIMRNPISMLYSAFWFSCMSVRHLAPSELVKGRDVFHNRITAKIAMFDECMQDKPLDKCVDMTADGGPVDYGFPDCGRTRLEMGLYYVHTRKWLSNVPREQMYFFTIEEIASNDQRRTARKILEFLELDLTRLDDIDTLNIQCNKNMQHTVDYKNDPKLMMRNDTRQILEKFFEPYNQMLADLLGDDKFLWRTQ